MPGSNRFKYFWPLVSLNDYSKLASNPDLSSLMDARMWIERGLRYQRLPCRRYEAFLSE
jgi:hypothetical protein